MSIDFRDFFYIDVRSLRLFRVLLGLVLLGDLLVRASDLTAHYTDSGVLPRQLLISYHWNTSFWSLAMVSGSVAYLCFFFGLVMIAAILLILGYMPRLMVIICWAGILSIQNRNPIIYQGGDDMLRMLLFWSVFLPLGGTPGSAGNKICNVATFAILCQVLLSLQCSGFLKGMREWWQDGSAVYYALSLDQLARPLGLWLRKHYDVTVLLTRMVYLTELLILPFFLLPFARNYIRTLVIMLLVGLFSGIICVMMIGVFPYCYLAAAALFLPSAFWDRVALPTALFRHQAGYHLHFIIQSFIGFVVTLVVLWNISTLPNAGMRFPAGFSTFMHMLRLDQVWGMFAPRVLKEDGWLILQARLRDDTVVDINAPDHVLTFYKPAYVLDRYKNDRWRKYAEQLFLDRNQHLRATYAACMMRSWNQQQRSPGKKVKSLSVIYMVEFSVPVGMQPVLRPVLLYDTGIMP